MELWESIQSFILVAHLGCMGKPKTLHGVAYATLYKKKYLLQIKWDLGTELIVFDSHS